MYIVVDSPNQLNKLNSQKYKGPWFVWYYADWCGHCQTMKPEWNKVVKKMKTNNNVNIAEVESKHIDNLVNKPTIQGFPTIKMYNSGKEIANFEDERVADKMEKFAMSNSKKYVIKPKTIKSRNIKYKKIKSKKPTSRTIKSKTIKSKKIKSKKPTTRTIKSKTNKSKTIKSKPPIIKKKNKNNKNYDLKKSTKSVFSKLINSFDRIGAEAKKDAELLTKAKHLL